MCNIVTPTSSSSTMTPTTSSTATTSSSTPTPTPEVLFALWSSTRYGSVSPTYLLLLTLNNLTGALIHHNHKHVKNINSFVDELASFYI